MSHILNLIEKQMAMTNVRNRLAANSSRPGQYLAHDGMTYGPYLLVSRECGSGGGLVARLAGELLGWDVFDARIVDEIARNAHVHQRVVQSVDEHVHSGWERTWREYLPDELADERYFHYLREVIFELGHHGNVVIVGRGAQYILPSQCAVRIRVVAPLEERIKRVAERRKMSLEEARLQVEAIDKQRVAFVWKIFKTDAGSPLNQDITINTAQLSIPAAVTLVLGALKERLGVIASPLMPPVEVLEGLKAMK
ncbi:MAG TPA: cytidylate kinase-like family protein [Verrucomicrobiae bacterium]|nr:cytidylate kinase-like family protein [Verrucomicrobiae bacterium]